jgi:hypothetical protein
MRDPRFVQPDGFLRHAQFDHRLRALEQLAERQYAAFGLAEQSIGVGGNIHPGRVSRVGFKEATSYSVDVTQAKLCGL